MYLTYIDESGKPDRTDPEPDYVLASLTVNEASWRDADERVRALKRRYFPDASWDEVEIHALEIFSHRGPCRDMSLARRLAVYEDALRIVSEIDCSVSAVLVRKDQLADGALEVESVAVELLFERLDRLYELANDGNRMAGQGDEFAIVLMDSISKKADSRIRLRVRRLMEDDSGHTGCRYLIEDPIFVDSRYRNLLQLIDCVAYCIRRHWRRAKVDEAEREMFESFFKLIEPKLRKDDSGTQVCGIRILP